MKLKVIRGVLLIALCCACPRAAAAQEIYTTNFADGDVSVLDAGTLAILARIPVTAWQTLRYRSRAIPRQSLSPPITRWHSSRWRSGTTSL